MERTWTWPKGSLAVVMLIVFVLIQPSLTQAGGPGGGYQSAAKI